MNSKDEMPVLDHLEELRSRLWKVLVVNLIVTLLVFSRAGEILRLLLGLNPDMQLVFIEPSEIMIVYLQIALVVAVAVCSPFTLYHIWGFIAKGLYENEKKLVKFALGMGFIFFILGVLFGYNVMAPISLRFFTRIAIPEVKSMISAKAYISFILMMLLTMGIVFNIPSVVYVATKLGVLNPKTLKDNSKIIIVVIFVIAAVVTPPDVISQTLVALPMVLLLQLSIKISERVYKENIQKELDKGEGAG